MNYKYSYKFANLKPLSTLDSSESEIISFSSSAPSTDIFPFEDIKRISREIFEESPEKSVPYSPFEGYEPLRFFLRGILFQKGSLGDHDNVVITSGVGQSLDIICRLLTNDGDTIICEEPSYSGALNIFKSNGLNIAGVPITYDGMDIDRLESLLIKYPNTKFIYTIPNFQNPTGITASSENRQAVYSLAHKYDVIVIEDDSYGDLRFGGADIPSIKSLDRDGRVIYCSDFSKILAPTFGVGYICADSILTAKFIQIKQACEFHTSTWSQMLIHSFFNEFDYFDYTYRISGFYRKKCELMLDNLKFDLPTSISFTEPEGGFFILATLPKGADVEKFCKVVLDKKVSIAPGTDFVISGKTVTHSFRLNHSAPSDEQIITGIKILSDAAKAFSF